jgi:hypothetical protein
MRRKANGSVKQKTFMNSVEVIVLALLLLSSACGFVGVNGNAIDPTQVSPAFWRDVPVERLIAYWGEPDSAVTSEHGDRRYTWTRRVATTQIGSTYLGADGKVKRHPNLVTSRPVVIQATTNAAGLVKYFQAVDAW